MKLLFSICLLAAAAIHAQELIPVDTHHRIYGMEEFFYEKGKIGDVEKWTGAANGIRVGYEYLKPNTFYAATEGYLGYEVEDHTLKLRDEEDNPVKFTGEVVSVISNIEQRVGYNLQSGKMVRSRFTPFAGCSWYNIGMKVNGMEADFNFENVFFGLAGFQANQQILNNFDLGLSIKGLVNLNSGLLGYEVSIPATMLANEDLTLDFQLQPYILAFSMQGASRIYGLRLQTGYRF